MKFLPDLTLKETLVHGHIMDWNLFEEKLLSPGKCMEINCAFGQTTKMFLLPQLHHESTIIGTDSSEVMVEYARKKYKIGDRIDFDILDIQAQNLPEQHIGQFDHVFSYPIINSRNNDVQEFKNVSKLLKRGGCFHLSMVIVHDAFRLYNKMLQHPIYGKYFREYDSDFHYHVNADGFLKRLIQSQGFEIKYCHYIENVIYKSDYILPNIVFELPFIHKLTPEEQKDLKDILKEKWEKMEKLFHRAYPNDPEYDPECTDLYDIVQVLAYKS